MILIIVSSLSAQSASVGLTASNQFVKNPDFWLSTSSNLMGTALFISRVHYPNSAEWFGYGTQLMGIPALTLSMYDFTQNQTDFATWGNLAYASWALGAVLVDHVFKVEYRDPLRPGIMVPYVAGYYFAIGLQAAAQYESGLIPWAIAGTCCVINTAASLYAHKKGTDFRR